VEVASLTQEMQKLRERLSAPSSPSGVSAVSAVSPTSPAASLITKAVEPVLQRTDAAEPVLQRPSFVEQASHRTNTSLREKATEALDILRECQAIHEAGAATIRASLSKEEGPHSLTAPVESKVEHVSLADTALRQCTRAEVPRLQDRIKEGLSSLQAQLQEDAGRCAAFEQRVRPGRIAPAFQDRGERISPHTPVTGIRAPLSPSSPSRASGRSALQASTEQALIYAVRAQNHAQASTIGPGDEQASALQERVREVLGLLQKQQQVNGEVTSSAKSTHSRPHGTKTPADDESSVGLPRRPRTSSAQPKGPEEAIGLLRVTGEAGAFRLRGSDGSDNCGSRTSMHSSIGCSVDVNTYPRHGRRSLTLGRKGIRSQSPKTTAADADDVRSDCTAQGGRKRSKGAWRRHAHQRESSATPSFTSNVDQDMPPRRSGYAKYASGIDASSGSSAAVTSCTGSAFSPKLSSSRGSSPLKLQNRGATPTLQTLQNVRSLFYSTDCNQEYLDLVEDLVFESLPPENVADFTVQPLRNERSMQNFLQSLHLEGGRWSKVRIVWHLAGGLEAANSISESGICCDEGHCACGRYGRGGYVALTAAKANAYAGGDNGGIRKLFVVLSLPEDDVLQGERGTRPSRTAADHPNHPTEYCFVDSARLHCVCLITYRWVPTERRERSLAYRVGRSNAIPSRQRSLQERGCSPTVNFDRRVADRRDADRRDVYRREARREAEREEAHRHVGCPEAVDKEPCLANTPTTAPSPHHHSIPSSPSSSSRSCPSVASTPAVGSAACQA